MSFNSYQKRATETFKEHKEISPKKARLLDWSLGLAGESGEVIELMKHHVFSNEPIDKMELAKEMGDVLWYLNAMATTAGLDMQDIADLNIAKLSHRYEQGRYNDAASAERHKAEKVFSDTLDYQILKARINKTPAPMNIIIVGPDGSGKTTLAKELAAHLGFKYHKCDYRQENKPELALSLLEEQINVVYDRFYYPDDVIYCKIKDIEQDEAYWKRYNDVLDKMEQRNTLVILVVADTEELITRIATRGDDYIEPSDINRIQELYHRWIQFIDSRKIATTIIDTTDESIDTLSVLSFATTTAEAGQKIFSNIFEDEDDDSVLTTEEKDVN